MESNTFALFHQVIHERMTNELRAIIKQCVSLDANDDAGTEICWEEMTRILSEDLPATICFFECECSDEEFYWLSTVFEDVAKKTQSKELIRAWRKRLGCVKLEAYCQSDFKTEHMRRWVDFNEYVRHVNEEIDYAEGQIEEQDN